MPTVAAGVVFQTDPDLSFVTGLARWIAPQTPGAGGTPEEPAPSTPSKFETECLELEAKGNFQELYKRFGGELQKRFGTADERDVENGYALFLQLLVHWELEIIRYVLLPRIGKLNIEPKPEFGSPSSWDNIEDLISAINKGEVHPFDAKMAVARGLADVLNPISEHFSDNTELLDNMNKITGSQ